MLRYFKISYVCIIFALVLHEKEIIVLDMLEVWLRNFYVYSLRKFDGTVITFMYYPTRRYENA